MKNWQLLIGMIIIAVAIIICGVLVSDAIQTASSNISQGLVSLGELIRSSRI